MVPVVLGLLNQLNWIVESVVGHELLLIPLWNSFRSRISLIQNNQYIFTSMLIRHSNQLY